MKTFAVMAAMLIAQPLHALPLSEPCQLTVGAVVGTHDTREVFAALDHINASKDEFETTDAYNRRLEQAVATSATAIRDGALCVSSVKRPVATEYDADTQTLWVALSEQVGISIFPSPYGQITVDEVVAAEEDSREKSAPQSNAYGTTVDVLTKHFKTASVGFPFTPTNDFMAKLKRQAYGAYKIHYGSVALPMPSDQARVLKGHVGIVFQYKVRPPFVAEGTRLDRATMDMPVEIFEAKQVVLGDIVAIGVVDTAASRVLSVVPVP